MRSSAYIALALALALAGCPAGPPATTGTPKMLNPTVITGTTKLYAPDGALAATLASPRVTLDVAGEVVSEERLSAAGAIELRRRFAAGRLVEEERFAPTGAVDERTAYRYDASGRLAEEAITFGDGTPHGRWVHQRDAAGRLVGRAFIKPDGTTETSETYRYAEGGKAATMVRARVGQWTFRYDDAGRVVHEAGGPASGDEMDQVELDYTYDARHRLIREVARGPGGRLQRELTVTY